MRKIASIAVSLLLLLAVLTGCSKTVVDTKYDFDYAVVKWPDGTAETIDIRSWKDYDGEQIQITDIMGNTYVFSSVNCVLVDEYAEMYMQEGTRER